MFKWWKYLTAVPQLVALVRGILELVRSAEDFLGGGAQGARKRTLVLDLLDTALELGGRLGIAEVRGIDRQKVREVAGVVVDQVVTVLNALGVFRHASPPPVANSSR